VQLLGPVPAGLKLVPPPPMRRPLHTEHRDDGHNGNSSVVGGGTAGGSSARSGGGGGGGGSVGSVMLDEASDDEGSDGDGELTQGYGGKHGHKGGKEAGDPNAVDEYGTGSEEDGEGDEDPWAAER